MNRKSPLFQGISGLGVVYAALFLAANFLLGSEPAAKSSGATVIKYYHSHKGTEIAGVFVIAVAAMAFTFFLSSLRRALGRTIEGRHLASIVTAGGAVYVGGLLLTGVLTVALVDASHYRMAVPAQTLNVLSSDDWVPVVAGLSMVTLAAGIGALRSAALPRWLAWASIGLGVLAIAGPLGAIAFLLAPVWTLVTGIVLLRSSAIDQSADTAETPSPALT